MASLLFGWLVYTSFTLLLCVNISVAQQKQECFVDYDNKSANNSIIVSYLQGDCSIPSNAQPRSVSTGWLITGELGQLKWDTKFASGAYSISSGVIVTLSQLLLVNARMSSIPGISDAPVTPEVFELAHPQSGLALWQTNITTDCFSINNMKAQLGPNSYKAGPWSVHISSFSSSRLNLTNVNISCNPPALGTIPGGSTPHYIVTDGLGLLNAVVAAQAADSVTSRIFLAANISIGREYWNKTVPITRNTSISGGSQQRPVVDWHMNIKLMELQPRVYMTFEDMEMMNAPPLRGAVAQFAGTLPMFAAPFWVVWYPNRTRNLHQAVFKNVKMVVSLDEYRYLSYFALAATVKVPLFQPLVAELRNSFIMEFPPGETNTDPLTMTFAKFMGGGVDGSNVVFTANPPTAFEWITPRTDVPTFDLNPNVSYSYVNQVGCYSLFELMSLLADIEAVPLREPLAIILYRNISLLDTKLKWPDQGYTVQYNVYLVNGHTPSSSTTLDFGQVPRFMTLRGTASLWLVFLSLSNMADVGQVAQTAVEDTRILPMTFVNKTSANTSIIIANCTVHVSYAEFKLISAAARSASYPPFVVQATSSTPTNIYGNVFVNRSAFILYSNMTFLPPRFGSLMYKNVYDPPNVPASMSDPPPKGSSSEDSSGGLSTGAVIGIAVACGVGGAAVVAGLVALALSRARRRESKPVKAPSPDVEISIQSTACDHSKTATPKDTPSGAECSKERAVQPSDGSQTSATSSSRFKQEHPQGELQKLMNNMSREIDDKQLVILDVLGQGGFGVVYKGMWKGLLVAIKTLTFQDKLFGGESAQRTAMTEAAIGASLLHPNVVITYTYELKALKVQGDNLIMVEPKTLVVTDWKLYIVQEFCDAGSLRQAVLRRRFWDELRMQPRLDLILEVATELAGGLAHLHAKNIIHGDLNPNNVLLKKDPCPKGYVCKLADFGLSMKMSAGQSHISNMRRGTPFYTAPEVMSHGNMTKAADTYSLGVMLWELFHSMMCYKVSPEGSFLARSIFPSFPRKCPPAFAQLASLCMSQDASLRPPMAVVLGAMKDLYTQVQQGKLVFGDHQPSSQGEHHPGQAQQPSLQADPQLQQQTGRGQGQAVQQQAAQRYAVQAVEQKAGPGR
mmetsp:Transcript_25649/g.55849  ORF Transcript_25649/g.55849 Transcript_25649/m.55849 type:complete len:1132 (+) Transcript_25649:194-3589(+)|eukprot:CAMPEP_0202913484 /NCGR_PEP_ID=MMETSP1392-20130828/60585_1 /ASSEMBLY_ACC=CAM_ASM_000868 /TAXON_ID=225041 /ORGANISM="Chlamydomonas chlamydogama, Strain SAG 11-48b" /LENGTH=1131 /DNA_ID=CAMNT_0049604757 /DNA_START=167 /DNA_END=3562 /DNA_ORIENTATION=-